MPEKQRVSDETLVIGIATAAIAIGIYLLLCLLLKKTNVGIKLSKKYEFLKKVNVFDEDSTNSDNGNDESFVSDITKLSKNLLESFILIKKMRSEVQERQNIYNKLRNDIEKTNVTYSKLKDTVNSYEELAKLKESEIRAISDIMRIELKKEGKKSFLKGLIVNFLFFILGIMSTIILDSILKS